MLESEPPRPKKEQMKARMGNSRAGLLRINRLLTQPLDRIIRELDIDWKELQEIAILKADKLAGKTRKY